MELNAGSQPPHIANDHSWPSVFPILLKYVSRESRSPAGLLGYKCFRKTCLGFGSDGQRVCGCVTGEKRSCRLPINSCVGLQWSTLVHSIFKVHRTRHVDRNRHNLPPQQTHIDWDTTVQSASSIHSTVLVLTRVASMMSGRINADPIERDPELVYRSRQQPDVRSAMQDEAAT